MPEMPELPPIAHEPISVVLLLCSRPFRAPANLLVEVQNTDTETTPVQVLESLVVGWVQCLEELHRPYELLVVDDGSNDGSAEMLAELAVRHPRLHVLRHDTIRGEGAALRTALEQAQYPLLFYTLCDPCYRPEDFRRLLDKRLGEGDDRYEIDQVHLMTGFRASLPVPTIVRVLRWLNRTLRWIILNDLPPPSLGWLGWRVTLGRMLVRFLFGVRSQDVACPFRLMRRHIFERIPIQSNGPFVHIEILVKANFLGHMLGPEELPLGVPAEPLALRAGPNRRDVWREARRVFRDPYFGPPILPESQSKKPSPGDGEKVDPDAPSAKDTSAQGAASGES